MIDLTFFIKFYRVESWIKAVGITILPLLLLGVVQPQFYLIVIVSGSLALAHTYSINNYSDYTETRENNFIGKQIKEGKLTKRKSLLLTFLPLLPFAFLFFYMNFLSIVLISSFVILYDLYSCPPTRLKKYPFGLIICPTCQATFLFFSSYFLISNQVTQKAIFLFLLFYSYNTFSSLIHEISHRNIDKKNKLMSIPNKFGIEKSLKLGKLIIVASLLISIVGIAMNFKENYIFFGSLIFNLLRYNKISKPVKDFEKLRNGSFGWIEGLYYVIVLSVQNFILFF